MDRDTVVFDIDGTIANVEHRLHLVKCDRPNHAEFHSLMGLDSVNQWAKAMIHSLDRCGFRVVFVSARPRTYYHETVSWLEKNGITERNPSINLLREDEKDSTPDKVLKVNWAIKYGLDRIAFWVDDRHRVVKALRELGITVLQCQEWPERGESCPNCTAGSIVGQKRPYGPKEIAQAASRMCELASKFNVSLLTVVDASRSELIRRLKRNKL